MSRHFVIISVKKDNVTSLVYVFMKSKNLSGIHQKKSNTRVLREEFHLFHSALQIQTIFIDFAHVHSQFLGYNDKILKHKSTF